MSTVGDILSTVGDIMINVGGYLEYHGGCSVPWGVILSTVGDVQYFGRYHDARGGYHEYRGGCSVPWGKNLLLFEYPTVLNTPTVLMISPHVHHDIPMVLNIPHGTQDSPPQYS